MKLPNPPPYLFWVLFLAGFLYCTLRWGENLSHLAYNPDEGAYLYSARFIREGKVPFSDFIHHQPPLYIYFLSLVTPDTSSTLFLPRLNSFLLHILTSLLLFWVMKPCGLKVAGWVSLFYLSFPLAHYHLLVLPYALMDLFFVLAVGLWLRAKEKFLVGAAPLLMLSWFCKPLITSYILAFLVYETIRAFIYSRFRRLIVFSATLILAFLLLTLVFTLHTQAGFVEVLIAQIRARILSVNAFDFWNEVVLKKLDPLGFTPITWALREHKVVWLSTQGFRLFPFGLLLFGLGVLFSFLGRLPSLYSSWLPHLRSLLLLGLVFSLAFNLLGLWGGPSWDHYQILYILPFSFFSALAIEGIRVNFLSRVLLGEWMIGVAGFVLAAFVFVTPLTDQNHLGFDLYRHLRLLPRPSAGILSMDPVVSYLLKVPHACGIHDPFNQYQPLAAVILQSPVLARFVVSSEEIIRCLEEEKEIPIIFTLYTPLFLDQPLREWVLKHPHRVVCLLPSLKPRSCLNKL